MYTYFKQTIGQLSTICQLVFCIVSCFYIGFLSFKSLSLSLCSLLFFRIFKQHYLVHNKKFLKSNQITVSIILTLH